MTHDTKAPLPERVNLKTAMRGITDYFGYEGSADICRAHIAALEAELAALKADPPYKSIRAGLLGRYTANLRERANIMHGALEWIKANWANQDISHTDFRVRSFIEANAALEDGKDGQ